MKFGQNRGTSTDQWIVDCMFRKKIAGNIV